MGGGVWVWVERLKEESSGLREFLAEVSALQLP